MPLPIGQHSLMPLTPKCAAGRTEFLGGAWTEPCDKGSVHMIVGSSPDDVTWYCELHFQELSDASERRTPRRRWFRKPRRDAGNAAPAPVDPRYVMYELLYEVLIAIRLRSGGRVPGDADSHRAAVNALANLAHNWPQQLRR